jgi:hypothetical protein
VGKGGRANLEDRTRRKRLNGRRKKVTVRLARAAQELIEISHTKIQSGSGLRSPNSEIDVDGQTAFQIPANRLVPFKIECRFIVWFQSLDDLLQQ